MAVSLMGEHRKRYKQISQLLIEDGITLELVLAALILGGALLMRVETGHTILGYPALARAFFLIAAAGGLLLVPSILPHDS
jgi:ubiquinone biosynthesis protein